MVYYFTSKNVKLLRTILKDYDAATEVSPYEYMRAYVEKYSNEIDESKLTWLADTFLGIQKHYSFLNDVLLCVIDELPQDDKEYFMIMFYAIVFEHTFEDSQLIYKCLFKLSKSLLVAFVHFIGNSKIIPLIFQITQSIYDTSYAKENIITPLNIWQPYICEMGNSYAEYVKNIENSKRKPLTVPIEPALLKRKTISHCTKKEITILPDTPPNSLKMSTKMLTKIDIDKRLKNIHEKNRQRAIDLLNNVKSKTYHFAQAKTEKYYKTISSIKSETCNTYSKPLLKCKQTFPISSNLPPIKDNVANLRRINKRIQIAQEEEVKWLQNILESCSNTTKAYELEENDRKEKERERLLDIEKKHLMGLLTHEEAAISKKKVEEENKLKHEQFMKEREIWCQEIENWKKFEIEKNRRNVEKLSMLELNLLQAKNEVLAKKKAVADKLKQETEIILENALKVKQEELDRKVNMIKEIKILAMVAKKTKVPKIIDLTESSGIGLLCEMSVAELQERLMLLKMSLHEELEKKKNIIKERHITAKQELEKTKISIKNYMHEQALARKNHVKTKTQLETPKSVEIDNLKRILEEKRKQRSQMTS